MITYKNIIEQQEVSILYLYWESKQSIILKLEYKRRIENILKLFRHSFVRHVNISGMK